MLRYLTCSVLISFIFTLFSISLKAQEAEQLIRIAEMGQLVDSVNVWGDMNRTGRYLVPEGTTIVEMISYGMGYNTLRGREAELDWSKVILNVKVSRRIQDQSTIEVTYFRYSHQDPEPIEMFDFELQNNDIISVQLKRRPSFRDYLQVFAPTLGALATTILLFERLTGRR